MVKLPKMHIKDVGPFMVLILLFCSLLGMALEDKKVIRGLISGFGLGAANEDSDDKLAEVLAVNCRLELIYLKRIYEDLSFNIPDATSTKSGNLPDDQVLTKGKMRKALSNLHPQVRENLFKCLRENYLVRPVSGEDVSSTGNWYRKHLESLFRKSNTDADSRRNLAEAPPPKSSPTIRTSSKRNAPPAEDELNIPIEITDSPPDDENTSGSKGKKKTKKEADDSGNQTIIIAVVVTAASTFLLAAVLFCCCHKFFIGGSGFDHKDDRPLLSLSMSDYSASGASPKAWAFETSVDKEKIGNQSYRSNLSGKKGTESLDGRLSFEAAGSVAASVAATGSSTDSSTVSSDTDASTSALKPPPGRAVGPAPGMLPLKPPPGRTVPLPPQPPASPEPPPAPSPAAPPPPPPPPKTPAPKIPAPKTPEPEAPAPEAPAPKAPAPPPPPPGKRSGPPAPGPPPPPPPGGKGGPRATPPPKGGMAPRPPAFGKAGNNSVDASKAKLKPFFWDKVMANPDHSMVWDQIKSGSFQFNEEMIESLFGYVAVENRNEKKKDPSREPPFQYVQLIDQKKAQNLSILLKALNVTTEEVHDALMEGNELPAELLETLLRVAPTAEEELKLRLYTGEMSRLGTAERFLKVLVDVPFAFRRLETLLFMGTLQEEAATVKESFATLEAACKELRSSRLFLKLLEAVLKTGNRMNDGTYRGGAQAFKLDTLLKLADVKGTDGKTTLLHFVVQEIIRTEGIRAVRTARESKSFSSIKSEDLLGEDIPEDSEEHYRSLGLQVVSGLGDQLENVRKAANLDADSLTTTIAKQGTSLVKAKSFLSKEMQEVDEDNGFHQVVKSFVQHAEGGVMQLLEEEKRIMALIKSTADYFHGNSGKEEGLRLFVIVRNFLLMLEKVCREVKEKPKVPTKPQKKDPPSRQTSTEKPQTPFSPDLRQKLFPAITERRQNGSDSSSSSSSSSDSD